MTLVTLALGRSCDRSWYTCVDVSCSYIPGRRWVCLSVSAAVFHTCQGTGCVSCHTPTDTSSGLSDWLPRAVLWFRAAQDTQTLLPWQPSPSETKPWRLNIFFI